MIVFEYFYDKMDSVFAPLIKIRAEQNYDDQYVVDSDDEVCRHMLQTDAN